MLSDNPVIIGIFIPFGTYNDYDHIVPAVGIEYSSDHDYDPNDVLIFYDNFRKKPFQRAMSEEAMGISRYCHDYDAEDIGGFLPLQVYD